MKTKIILLLLFVLNFSNYDAQNITKIVAFVGGNNIDFIEIHTDQNVFVLNGKGQISTISSPVLNGNLDYFDDPHYNKEKFGKIKNFGDQQVEYWLTSDETDPKYGKVKRIGTVEINYWDSRNYEREKLGKVKSIGIIPIDYWEKDGFDVDRVGKIKSIGKIHIDYYEKEPMNDGKVGKLKSFGPVQFDYWNDSFSNNGKFGKLKSIIGNSENILVKYNISPVSANRNAVPY